MENKQYISPEIVDLGKLHLKKRHRIEIHDITGIKFSSLYPILRGDNQTTPKNVSVIEKYIRELAEENLQSNDESNQH